MRIAVITACAGVTSLLCVIACLLPSPAELSASAQRQPADHRLRLRAPSISKAAGQNTMQLFLRSGLSGCTAPSKCRSTSAAAVPTAVPAAAVTRQHPVTCRRHQASQPRYVVAKVRMEDLERNAGMQSAELAAEALQTYMELEQSGELNSVTVGNLRLKYGIKRADDGRVQLRRSDGVWMQLKLDMEIAGTMLLRDMADDSIWVLQTDRLQQIDLSDDYMVFTLFADNKWEEQVAPIQISDERGVPEPLQMSAQQFRDYVGLIKLLQEAQEQSYAVQEEGVSADEPIDVTAEVTPSPGSRS